MSTDAVGRFGALQLLDCLLVLDRPELITMVGLKAEFSDVEPMDIDPEDMPD